MTTTEILPREEGADNLTGDFLNVFLSVAHVNCVQLNLFADMHSLGCSPQGDATEYPWQRKTSTRVLLSQMQVMSSTNYSRLKYGSVGFTPLV